MMPFTCKLDTRLCAAMVAAWASFAGTCLSFQAKAASSEAEPAGETAADPLPAPTRLGGAPDLAYAAYQRGYYITAMREAVKRIDTDPTDGPSMTLIGELYARGLGVRRDSAEAARWYKLAADRADPQAAFALALAKLNGDGVPKDRTAAEQLFEKAAAQNHPGALYNLGVLAIENNGVTKNFEKAAEFFKKAAELGNSDGAYALGLLYKSGNGVEKSDEKAASWIGRAAKDGNVPAEVEYAIMLFNGAGIEKNETAAAKLFLKAAVSNNPVAQNRVARILAVGRGLPTDMIEAMKWHLLAKAAGVKDAWLDEELEKLSPREKADVELSLRRYMGR
ncbi:MAG TPA: tetratricopeptide repeat protein [Methylocella sp.]|nr:tetratricopeptide repeat protein [Methylocella sp.]